MLKDNVLDIALHADYETTIVLLNTFKFLLEISFLAKGEENRFFSLKKIKNFWQLKHDKYPLHLNNISYLVVKDLIIFNPILTSINNVLKVAAMYHGKIYSNFVINVLVPHAFNKPVIECKFINDIEKNIPIKLLYADPNNIYISNNGIQISIFISESVPVTFQFDQLYYSSDVGFTLYGSNKTHMLMSNILNISNYAFLYKLHNKGVNKFNIPYHAII